RWTRWGQAACSNVGRDSSGFGRALADRHRLGRWAVAEQVFQERRQRDRLESFTRARDLVGAPPAVIEGPALLTVVEAGGVDGNRRRAAEEEALAVQHLAVAPLHDPLALPHPAHFA